MAESNYDPAVVERSMRAVTAIRQVVHAIWALSRAQMPLVERAAVAAGTYQQWVETAVEQVAGAPRANRAARTLYVVFGPERPFSSNLARRVADTIPEDGSIGVVGHRFSEAVRQLRDVEARVRFRCAGSVTPDDLHEVAVSVATHILDHGRGAVVILMHPVDGQPQMARAPVIAGRRPVDHPPETYSPLETVVAAAMREATIGRVAVAAVETLRAELRARMTAADAARRACDDRLALLQSAWHRRRQETITRELLEIVAGREAAGAVGR